jgi:hypothetical protein
MLKNSVFYFTKRFLHDRKLPSVVTIPNSKIYNSIGTQSPRKADYCKIKNKELFNKNILKTKSSEKPGFSRPSRG